MKILVFGASSSRESINRAFARHAAYRLHSEVPSGLEIEELDLNDYEMPIYSIDREREMGIPRAARHFFEQVGAADGLRVEPKLPGASMWDQRYSKPHAAYGTEPNSFLRAVAGRIPPGPVLVIAAGEGRNAVFLAERGHPVTAMDQSEVALEHAAALAANRGVQLETVVADLADFDFGESRWSGVVSVWAHVPVSLRKRVHAVCVRALEPGGAFILEAYAPAHLDRPGKGGPPVAELLFEAETVRRELKGLDFELCQESNRVVSEGRDHQGPSATTQILAFRPTTQEVS